MTKKLTRELIVQKCKSDRIESIKNLNLWGSNIDDISLIKDMISLEIVSLSVNKIRTLKPFSNLTKIRELYLRNNSISDISEIKYLKNCSNLKILWLSENPICNNRNYRMYVLNILPQLAKLDDVMVSEAERQKCANGAADDEGEYDGNEEEEEEDNNYNNNMGNMGNNMNNQVKRSITYQGINNNNNNKYGKYQVENNAAPYNKKAPGNNHNMLANNFNSMSKNNMNNMNNPRNNNEGEEEEEDESDEENNYTNNNNEGEYDRYPRKSGNLDRYGNNNISNSNVNKNFRKMQTSQNRSSNFDNNYYGNNNNCRNNNLNSSNMNNKYKNQNQSQNYNPDAPYKYKGNNQNNQRGFDKNNASNVLKSILLLLDELNKNELIILSNEVEKSKNEY